MRIELTHTLDRNDVIGRLDAFLDSVMAREWPNGIEVTGARKQWVDSRMTFGFTVGKGGLGASVDGTIDVDDRRVILESALPMLARVFVGEDRIREAVTRELQRAIDRSGS